MLVELHLGELERGVEQGAGLGLARPRRSVKDFSNRLPNSSRGPGIILGGGCREQNQAPIKLTTWWGRDAKERSKREM